MMITRRSKARGRRDRHRSSDPALVAQLRANIDPQHGCHNAAGRGKARCRCPPLASVGPRRCRSWASLPVGDENELVIFTEKPDLDSIAAVALHLSSAWTPSSPGHLLYHLGVRGIMQRVRLIDELDCGLMATWRGSPGEFVDALHPELRGLAQ